jgi:cytochrome b561
VLLVELLVVLLVVRMCWRYNNGAMNADDCADNSAAAVRHVLLIASINSKQEVYDFLSMMGW